MKMPTIKITDLADVLIEELNEKDVTRTILGIRPGEKVHELLLLTVLKMQCGME